MKGCFQTKDAQILEFSIINYSNKGIFKFHEMSNVYLNEKFEFFNINLLLNYNLNIIKIKRLTDNLIIESNFDNIEKISYNYMEDKLFLNLKEPTYNKISLIEYIHPKNYKYEEIEEQIINKTKEFINSDIRLNKTLKNRKETPFEFLIKFFTIWNIPNTEKTKETIFVDNQGLQCETGARRSLGDIYTLLKYYYPNITIKEIIKILYVDLFNYKAEEGNFRSSNCSIINKRVWYFTSSNHQELLEKNIKDEYGFKYNDYIKILE